MLPYVPDEVEALKEFRRERKEYMHKKNEMIKKKGCGREEQVNQFLNLCCISLSFEQLFLERNKLKKTSLFRKIETLFMPRQGSHTP